ncbi:Methionyl-tRNA formyltransferase [Rubripirellula amarantea]|uniref:Methionyl-tRNA formyltransferase n=1 Tax=Rubripirellula amarantea TaxID=2527999 RepID=A0A5C5WEG9_9BACT|nr:methionyl-tRNA formyltransferase [Rubripirellula amarantea]TWT49134.1 Methionyl-tRNA formyltransferase [Rubripirellula amarantea]
MASERLKLVVMGTGPFAVPSFNALLDHDIRLVVTRPAPPVKSRGGPPPSPVRDWAVHNTLPVFDPVSINDPDSIETVAKEQPDLLVVCDYGQILKPAALAVARLGCINLHGSLLPAYRGAAPVQWAMLNGDPVTGVSVIHMTPRLDGGPVLCTRETPISDDEDAGQLEERLSAIGVEATLEAVAMLQSWDGQSDIGVPQDPSRVSKAPRLSKADGEIDWGRSGREISCHVRGMSPWPVAFTFFRSHPEKPPIRLAVKSVRLTDQTSEGFHSGEIVKTEAGYLVATGDLMVELISIVPAGKREMSADAFFRGHQPSEGSRLFSL